MTWEASLKANIRTQKLQPRLIEVFAEQSLLPEVHTKDHTRKQVQCMFGDIAYQSELVWSSKVEKGMSPTVEISFGM